jgi:D-aminopeptidase
VGVLVQSNFGGILTVNGAPVGRETGRYYMAGEAPAREEGSCMIIVATDAPLSHRNLERIARRAVLGIGRCGGFCSNGSGDYVIAFSTVPDTTPDSSKRILTGRGEVHNSAMSPLFLAVVEACEEAIINSLCMANTVQGYSGHRSEAIPLDRLKEICSKYGALNRNSELPAPGKN